MEEVGDRLKVVVAESFLKGDGDEGVVGEIQQPTAPHTHILQVLYS
jgi:hypothetical protein